MLKGQANPIMIVAAVVVVLGGLIFVIWKTVTSPSGAEPVIVKPASPDDPKYRPDPKLGLGGGGS